jgi:hypothetical protein
VLGLILGQQSATLKDGYYVFPQSLQESAGIVPRLSNDHFHPNPFQLFISHPTIDPVLSEVLTSSVNKHKKFILARYPIP